MHDSTGVDKHKNKNNRTQYKQIYKENIHFYMYSIIDLSFMKFLIDKAQVMHIQINFRF